MGLNTMGEGGEGGRDVDFLADFPGKISAEEIQGKWVCWSPIVCAWGYFDKTATGPDHLTHSGCVGLCCIPVCPLTSTRERVPGTNGFVKTDPYRPNQKGDVDVYLRPGFASRNSDPGCPAWCNWVCLPQVRLGGGGGAHYGLRDSTGAENRHAPPQHAAPARACAIQGTWVPTRVSEWRRCPAAEHDRIKYNKYVVEADGRWINVLWAKCFGRVAPTGQGNVWEGWGEDPDWEFGSYACRMTLLADGTLEVDFGRLASHLQVGSFGHPIHCRHLKFVRERAAPLSGAFVTCSAATLRLQPKGSPDACKLWRPLSAQKSPLLLSHPLGGAGQWRKCMAIGPKWSSPRNASGHWDYIDLGVGEFGAGCIEVHLNSRGFIVWQDPSRQTGHKDMVFDVSMWKIEAGNHLVLVKGVGPMTGKTMDYEDNRGRLFVQNQDSTISPMFARHLVLAAWNDERAII